MKNLHFCTPKLLEYIKNPETNLITTFRTGWTPHFYAGDIINLIEVNKPKDIFICKARVKSVNTLRFSMIKDMFKFKGMFPEEEINRYHRDFNNNHWFFEINLEKKWKKTIKDY